MEKLREKLRASLGGSADSLIKAFYDKYGKWLSAAKIIAETDYANLVEKLANVRVSALGTPVIDHVTFYLDGFTPNGAESKKKIFQLNAYKDIINSTSNIKSSYFNKVRDLEKLQNAFSTDNKIYLFTLDNIFINVNKSNNTLRTQVIGEDGTVKEFMGADDYTISFEGVLAGNNQFQEDTITIKKMEAMFTQSKVVNISSLYLNTLFGVDKIVIDSYGFNQVKNYANLTEFSISTYSDYDKDFIIPYTA